MLDDLPFRPCLSVDMDVSFVALCEGAAVWFDNYQTHPTVVWVNPHDLGHAEQAILAGPDNAQVRRLTPIADPTYQRNWWSVGTHLHKGFGSIGA